ncbi:hypothetical protein LZ31DRAFT_560201 [Colletotrichum somersetense]|nr:hypothetical protein LZ31DRAFT_560201 [Colletotrichum somersetense]
MCYVDGVVPHGRRLGLFPLRLGSVRLGWVVVVVTLSLSLGCLPTVSHSSYYP